MDERCMNILRQGERVWRVIMNVWSKTMSNVKRGHCDIIRIGIKVHFHL